MTVKKIVKLLIGLSLYAVGIVLAIQGDLGLAPWDAFHIGVYNIIDLSFGQVTMLVGFAIALLVYILGEGIGIGTIANVFVIGLIIDLIFKFNLIPQSTHWLIGALMLVAGMVVIGFASYFYLGAEFGAGPRDGLMVAITRLTGRPVGFIRSSIELLVLAVGWLLGAKIGLGTLILALGIGPIVQMVFKFLNFNVVGINHKVLMIRKVNEQH